MFYFVALPLVVNKDVQCTVNVKDEVVVTVHGACDVSCGARIYAVVRRANVSNTHSTLSQRPDSLAWL